jgi:hypothetical protein
LCPSRPRWLHRGPGKAERPQIDPLSRRRPPRRHTLGSSPGDPAGIGGPQQPAAGSADSAALRPVLPAFGDHPSAFAVAATAMTVGADGPDDGMLHRAGPTPATHRVTPAPTPAATAARGAPERLGVRWDPVAGCGDPATADAGRGRWSAAGEGPPAPRTRTSGRPRPPRSCAATCSPRRWMDGMGQVMAWALHPQERAPAGLLSQYGTNVPAGWLGTARAEPVRGAQHPLGLLRCARPGGRVHGQPDRGSASSGWAPSRRWSDSSPAGAAVGGSSRVRLSVDRWKPSAARRSPSPPSPTRWTRRTVGASVAPAAAV